LLIYELLFIYLWRYNKNKTMKGRPLKLRRVYDIPNYRGFKPIGLKSRTKDVVLMNFEEYEAIRLSDYELRNQMEAATIMEVSRPTFTRIYKRARQKVAIAFVEGRQIVFEGGKVYIDNDWLRCNQCGCVFTPANQTAEAELCPLCKSIDLKPYDKD